MQLLQIGRSSPHLILRLRHVKQPVLVLFRSFGFEGGAEAELPVGVTSPAPVDMAEPLSMWIQCSLCLYLFPRENGFVEYS